MSKCAIILICILRILSSTVKIRPDKKGMAAERPKEANWWEKVDMWERDLFAGLRLTGVSLEKQQRAAPASTTLTPPVKLALCSTDNAMVYI